MFSYETVLALGLGNRQEGHYQPLWHYINGSVPSYDAWAPWGRFCFEGLFLGESPKMTIRSVEEALRIITSVRK